MIVNEIFYSIQGEGAFSGIPSIFIRFSGCNLRCSFCDTAHALDRRKGTHSTCDTILKKIDDYKARHVVITGGEPLLNESMEQFCQLLKKKGYYITIETNGTILPIETCDFWSVSPKFAHQQKRYKKTDTILFENIVKHVNTIVKAKNYQIKFVIKTPDEMSYIRDFLKKIDPFPHERVILMPEGTNRNSQVEKLEWISELCKTFGYRLIPRLHTIIWNDKRGV